MLSLIAIAISVLWTLGLYSLLGYTYNVLASMIVPLIVVLAIADDVHIMQHWDEERRHLDAEQAFKNTVAHLAAPLLGASGTTALGMLSLATSDVVAVQSFGVGSAIGVMVDFAISLVVMPTFLSLVKPETGTTPHERYLLPPLQRIAAWFDRASAARVRGLCRGLGGVGASGPFAFASIPTTSTSSAAPTRSASPRRSSIRSSPAFTASRSCSRGRPTR